MKQNYELVLVVHPSFGNQLEDIVKKYIDKVVANQGELHLIENWGRRQLAYPIKKMYKAHYLLLSIGCDVSTMLAIKEDAKFDEKIMRMSILKTDQPQVSPSQMMNEETLLLTSKLIESLEAM